VTQSLPTSSLSAATMTEAFRRTVAAHGDRVAMRTPDGVKLTWGDWGELSARYAAGLRGRGSGPGDVVALVMTNRPEAYVFDMAALLTGAAAFAIYVTSSPEQIAHQLTVAGSRIVITEPDLAERTRAGAALLEHPPDVFVLGLAPDEPSSAAHLKAPTAPPLAEFADRDPGDLATLIFTSGTTGLPKAAELTHAAVLAACRSSNDIVPLRPGTRLASYLPMANIADRVLSYYYALVSGGTITFVRELRRFIEALPDVRPTILLCVPRTWERLAAALAAAGRGSYGDRFDRALEARITEVRALQVGDRVPDDLARHCRESESEIFAPLLRRFGLHECAFAMSGSAPIGVETLEFCSAVGIPVREGYGMSETTGIVMMNPADRFRIGTVGKPAPDVDARLGDDGELLVHGPMVMRGYRGQPEATAEVLDQDGWMHTGDLASIDEDGYVRIIGRKKEILINSSGKNMSPALIERAVAAESDIVGTVVCIGDGQPFNVALVLLDQEELPRFLQDHGYANVSPEDVVELPAVRAEVEAAIERGNAKLSRPEQIRRHHILPEAWVPGGEEMTPTMKVRRSAVSAKYAEVIEELYAAAPAGA